MKLFKEGLVRIDCGSAFHNFEAEYEKERSYNAVRDLGTERSPFSDDLKERVWVSDTGLSRPDIYAGAKLLSALYVKYRLFNVLCWLWNIYEGAELPSVYLIINTKHCITYLALTQLFPVFVTSWSHIMKCTHYVAFCCISFRSKSFHF